MPTYCVPMLSSLPGSPASDFDWWSAAPDPTLMRYYPDNPNWLGAFALSGFAVNHLDIGPRYAGILLGFSNTAGTLPGIIGVTLTGMILDATGSWQLVFLISAGIYVFGLIVWWLFATGERIFD